MSIPIRKIFHLFTFQFVLYLYSIYRSKRLLLIILTFAVAGWDVGQGLTEKLYPSSAEKSVFKMPDYEYVHKELQKSGVN